MTDINVYFAPMEGITDDIYRRVHHECFPSVKAYYIPFISPTKNLVLTGREKHNVLPEYNTGVPCIPQVLTKDADHFLWASALLADMGYKEINLNAGCPSGTVTAKGKGAGMLKDTENLARFLDMVCAHSPLPVSVKTRIGFDEPAEWEELLRIYASYPLAKIIIHPRTCRERYDPGTIHSECLDAAYHTCQIPLIINGDLFSPSDVKDALDAAPDKTGIMLGRGLVSNPAMARLLSGGVPLSTCELTHFHNRLVEEFSGRYQQDIVFMKLRVVMKHIACCFRDASKMQKRIRKSRKLSELLETDSILFNEYTLKDEPYFTPDD